MNNRRIFTEARRLVFDSGKLLCMALGFCIVLFSAVMTLVAADIVNIVLSNTMTDETLLALSIYAAIAVTFVLITVPAMMGYFELLYSIYKGEREAYVIDAFRGFSHGRYLKNVFFGISHLLRGCFTLLLPIFIALGVYATLTESVKGMYMEPFSVLFKLPAFFVFFFLHLLFSMANIKGFLGIFYRIKGIKRPYIESKKVLFRKTMRTFRLKLMFFTITLVSFLSVGMLFLVTVPIMVNAYFIYAKQITENINEL
jgi:hypothetical protein